MGRWPFCVSGEVERMENELSGAPEATASPADGLSALDAELLKDDYIPEDADAATTEGQPAGETPASDTEVASVDASVETVDGDDSTEDADAPEDLKAIRGKLSRSEYRKLAEAIEAKQEARITAAQAEADQARAEQATRDATVAEIRAKRGAFIGEGDETLPNGAVLPSFATLERLMPTRAGRDELYEKYGLDEDASEARRAELTQRRAMLDGSLGDFRVQAWHEMGGELAAEVATAGLPIDAVWKGVTRAGDVLKNVVAHLRAEGEAALTKQKNEYEGRLKAVKASVPAQAARSAARTHPTPETGGRSDTSSGRIYTTSELDDINFFREHESDIDRAYLEGRIVAG